MRSSRQHAKIWLILAIVYPAFADAALGQYRLEEPDRRSYAQRMHDMLELSPNMQPSERERYMQYYAFLDYASPEEFAQQIGEQRVNRRSYQDMNADNFE